MIMETYNKKVMEHFRNPHNYGKIENADGIGTVGNIQCGDIMKVYIKVKNDKISDIKFETLGCPAAIAVSSVLMDIAKGKMIKDALKITNKDILKELGKLPMIKIHCSVLGSEALHEAIYDYYKKNNMKISKQLETEHGLILKRNKEHKH